MDTQVPGHQRRKWSCWSMYTNEQYLDHKALLSHILAAVLNPIGCSDDAQTEAWRSFTSASRPIKSDEALGRCGQMLGSRTYEQAWATPQSENGALELLSLVSNPIRILDDELVGYCRGFILVWRSRDLLVDLHVISANHSLKNSSFFSY